MFRSVTTSLVLLTAALGHAAGDTPAPTDHCGPVELTIYFSPESGSLSDAAVAVLDNAAETLAGCQILGAEMSVISSDASANPALPAARRAAVLTRLAEAGLRIGVTARTAQAEAPSGFEIPLSRRVYMTIDAVPAITS